MSPTTADFYNPLAAHYHLIFEDWDRSIDRQAHILNPLLAKHTRRSSLNLLDCACGIGTQAIGFAQAGHRVVASDASPAAVARARLEATQRHLDIAFFVSDMTSLAEIPGSNFDVVAALDNALPHLSPPQLSHALQAAASKLAPKGLFIASIRDYDRLILERPTTQPPAFYGQAANTQTDRRIVHQLWDWIDNERYTAHLYITTRSGADWVVHHFGSCPKKAASTSQSSSPKNAPKGPRTDPPVGHSLCG
jgi:glycine/sarcosine N-methyltransferase